MDKPLRRSERILQRNNMQLRIMESDKKQSQLLDRLFQIRSPLNNPAEVVSVLNELGQVCKQQLDQVRALKALNLQIK